MHKVNTDLFGAPIIKDKDNVYLNNKKSTKQKDLSNEVKIEYVIEVVVKDEKQQEEIYNEMIQRGFRCRVLTL